jgi:hypothetical protein
MFCNDIDFKYMPTNLIDQEINDECFDCSSFGTAEGECKGMVGGAPCLSFEDKSTIEDSNKSSFLSKLLGPFASIIKIS